MTPTTPSPDSAAPMADPLLIGVDFTSTPRAGKPITVAIGRAEPGATPRVRLARIARFRSLDDWLGWLCLPQAWVGAFDFPFGLPRDFAAGLGWPLDGLEPWVPVTQRLAALSRAELVGHCRAWCDARPPGSKFAHRATDRPAGSSPSMKWVNPPVALMLHEGAPRLLQAGVTLPGLRHLGADPTRVALEGYPALLARGVLGRESYKSDDPARRHCPARRAARERLVAALQAGEHPFETRIAMADARDELVAQAQADELDAVLCLAMAAWAWRRQDSGWGLPPDIDPVEGWILGAPA
ncbi:MAG: DUF429 domain-containing protein [Burkholderiales bacterium]